MITYRIGDATEPVGDGVKLICHVTNNMKAWGAGFVLALSRRWINPEIAYRHRDHSPELGTVQFVNVGDYIHVANMCAQNGFPSRQRPVALDYQALGLCLDKVATEALELNASVHGPRFGAGLAGGRWPTIEALIKQRLCAVGVPVTIYDLPKQQESHP